MNTTTVVEVCTEEPFPPSVRINRKWNGSNDVTANTFVTVDPCTDTEVLMIHTMHIITTNESVRHVDCGIYMFVR